ncbi:MAG: molecular chaperone DnaK, partial [bacterium]
ISESQEAKLNTKQLMEKLRPLWERHEGYNNLYSSNVLKVMLFDKTGNAKPNFELDINAEALENLLRERIEKGVKNFFEALKLTFRSAKIREMNNIIIFLAGNSSKSPIVADLFKQYIAERTEFILKELKGSEDREYFKVYPPLGTPEAQEIQKNNGIEVDENDLTRPTGKTGVAFGLLEGRPGSRIKVIAEKKSTDEIKFNYYIGYNAKKKFRPVFGRDTEYNKWINFIDASETDFEIYYTDLPEATNNNLPIKEVSKKICRIAEADESANVYIRAVEPSVIEYVAATEEGIGNNEFLGDIIRLELE